MSEVRAWLVQAGPCKRVLPEQVIKKEPWRQELMDVLMEFVHMALYPTPYGLRQVAEVLMELRELMLMDGLDHSLTIEAMQQIKYWIENTRRGNSYDLGQVLREFRRFVEELEEGEEFGDERQGGSS